MILDNSYFITSDIKESPRFFKKFTVSGKAEKAVLQITGLGLYCAFINGKKAGDSYLAPGFNDYDGYLRVETLDVTDLITEGENLIEVYLGNGWYKGRFGLMSFENTWGDKYLLAADLAITQAGADTVHVKTDESWCASESVIKSNSIYDGEVRDDSYVPAEAVPCRKAECKYNLTEPVCPPIRAKLERKPQLIVSPKGEKILDFGQNLAGIVRIHDHMKKGEWVHLTFGEILIDGCFCNSNYRDAVGGFKYTSDGVEKDAEPMFTYFGFRYALVETSEGVEPDPSDFTAVVLYTDLKSTMRVHTSDAKLNRLLENSLWGQRSNFLDVPTDCPQRNERLGWTGDAQVFANTACFHMDCEQFYRKYLQDLRFDQTAYMHGDVPMFSPCQKDGAPGGPAWADAATIIPWTMYEHYANKDNLKEAYPLMRDYVETLIKKDLEGDADHILKEGHCFGDWLALDGASPNAFKGGTDDVYVRSVYYWYSVRLAANAAKVLGNSDDHQKYSSLAQDIRSAIIHEFFSPAGRLCIDTQTGYILALHFKLYPDREKILEGFKTRLSKDRLRLKTGFVGTGFLLQTLFEYGMDDYAYRMLFTNEFPGWFYALNLGATTIWERWNSVMPDGTLSPTGMNSLNHYSYGAVASAVYSCIAGLQNAAPGWKQAVIAPRPNRRLRQIEVAFDSPAGTWESAWEIRKDGSLFIKAVVPEGTSARIILPFFPERADVKGTESGKYTEAGYELQVSAGTYEYEYKPTVDFLHPYSGETFIADIVEDENAVNALKNTLPGVFDEALASVEKDAACNLAGAIFFSPVPDLPGKIDEILRGVSYEVK